MLLVFSHRRFVTGGRQKIHPQMRHHREGSMTHGLSRWTRDSANARKVFILALLGAAALPAAAMAQAASPPAPPSDAAAAPASAEPFKIPEIIVTAQKRSQNVQAIPVSMTVVRPDQLTSAGVHNFQDLANVAPSLTVTGGGTGQNSSVLMRGIGAQSFSYLTEPDVSIIIDDVPVASQSQAFSNLSDVAQVEVLRGPQTTLFGKSASAGVVSITTQKPTRVLSGRVAVSATDDGEETVDATVSGPISDTLAYRLTASLDDFRGNEKNIYNGHWLDGEDTYNLRGKLHWTPTSKLTVDVVAAYSNAWGSLGIPFAPVYFQPGSTLFGVSAATAFAGLNVNRSNSSLNNDLDATNNYAIGQGSVKIAYDAGPVTLMSITGDSSYVNNSLNDFDGTAANVVGIATKGVLNGSQYQYFTETTRQLSQEFRAVSAPGAFRYVAGLWYADKTDFYSTIRGPNYTGNRAYANYYAGDESKQYAAFGQSEWDFAPKLTLVTGVRYGVEVISYGLNNIAKGYPFLTGSHSESAPTGKVSLEYKPVSNINLFGSYTRGYKGETYDLSSALTPTVAALGPVKSENSNNFELGAKTQFFERRLTLNVTAFDADYYNFQAQTLLPTFGAGFILANVGQVETRGLELDGSWRATSALTFSFGGAYLDAFIKSFPNGQCYYSQTAAQGCVTDASGSHTDLSGKKLPNAPKWKGNIDATYKDALASTGFDAILNASLRLQSIVNYSLSSDPLTVQPAFVILNLGAAIQPTENGKYKIGLFVNNVFDTHYYNGFTDSSSVSLPNLQGHLPRDFRRYAGVRASYEF
jgi:iron complex outermembrane receptor protein